MARKLFLCFALLSLLASLALPALSQVSAESAVKGNIAGLVTDPSGAVVSGAKITLNGPTGTKVGTSDGQGGFLFLLLTPGTYSVRVEKQGFKSAELKNIGVDTNRTSNLKIALETGTVSETIEVSANAITVDTTSSAVTTNLNDEFYEKVPVGRNVSGLFYAAPGVASGGGTGVANPSISGGTGLENQYMADGVNITDTAFGGLGTFSRVYGSVGTGINLAFVKEVEVKTGGFEPQYGKTTGGIVQIVTKSGTNQYHGAITGFLAPQGMEADHLNPDQFGLLNQLGALVHNQSYDVSGELGGPVPGLKNHLFFFGSIDPTWTNKFVRAPDRTGAGLFALGVLERPTRTINYAAKLTFRLSDNHTLEGSVYGDPTTTDKGPFRRVIMDNTSAFSSLDYGSRNAVVRYNGTPSPTWTLNASATWMHNHFSESGYANEQEITDQTQTSAGQRGQYVIQGLGFVEPTRSENYGYNIDTSKTVHALGEHTFSIGYRHERPYYDGQRANSGPLFGLPGVNHDGTPLSNFVANGVVGSTANENWYLRTKSSCTLCPIWTPPGFTTGFPIYLQTNRSEFALDSPFGKAFRTSGLYHAVYVNDAWTPNRYVTLNLGVRWEQQHLKGEQLAYTFVDNWSPRIGISVDPKGDRKSKIFANYGRFTYGIPLDLAERSLTNEQDMFSLKVIPVINADNTVSPPDPAAISSGSVVLNKAAGGINSTPFVSFSSAEPIFPGTKMSYLDEFVVGAEHEFAGGIVLSGKFIRRDLKRIVEDTGGISPEAANGGVPQQFAITNVSKSTDIFTNPTEQTYPTAGPTATAAQTLAAAVAAGCPIDQLGTITDAGSPIFLDPVTDTFNNVVPPGAVCFGSGGPDAAISPINGQQIGAAVPDGVPDGFVNPIRQYTAVEIEVNKAFSKNWLMRANWRIAKLYGNFEGAFRNDNGQSDPSISSLFDFTPGVFNLLGDQFKPGVLNTDRRHIVNAFFSYYVDHTKLKGLTIGTGINMQSGTPINDLKAHPVYLNAGEVPVNGRGSEGRTPFLGTVDAHLDYAHALGERMNFHVGIDLFNIANSRRSTFFNQNEDLAFGVPNVDFLKPNNIIPNNLGDGFQNPFSARIMLKFVF
jgi:Carboxypeptidase regulatory-like domain/TonB-dependent Receptor Plug Domain